VIFVARRMSVGMRVSRVIVSVGPEIGGIGR